MKARRLISAILASLLVLAFAGCASTTGAKWYAPATWFSHAPASRVDAAQKKEQAAAVAVDQHEDAAVHAATVEILKASLVAQVLAESRERELTQRFIGNGLGLLQQVTPLTAIEVQDATKLVRDLLSPEVEKRKAAEERQAKAETELQRVSNELTQARAALDAAKQKTAAMEAQLRVAFDRENELANQLRAQQARFWIAVGVAGLLLAFSIYARIALGGVGAAIHAAGVPANVVQAIDTNLSSFGQYLVRTGRVAAAKTEAALAARMNPTPK